MVNLVYRATSVGPVCKRVAAACPESIKVFRDTQAVPKNGTLVRWGSRFVGESSKVINTMEAVSLAKDKKRSRQILGDLAPDTGYTLDDVGYPCVVRPQTHHAGKKFFVCHNRAQVFAATRKCGKNWYASELIEKDREFRVFILNNYVVCVSERFPANPTDVAWNLAVGGRLINLRREDWPIQPLVAALEAAKHLGLDWTAIDLATAKDASNGCLARTVVFEANTAPGLRNPYTISQIAKALSWTDTHTPNPRTNGDTWKHLIHPSLSGSTSLLPSRKRPLKSSR